MIRRLRRRHLVMALLLAVIVPLILAAGLLARRDFPVASLPATLLAP